jgi:hypothetical protein
MLFQYNSYKSVIGTKASYHQQTETSNSIILNVPRAGDSYSSVYEISNFTEADPLDRRLDKPQNWSKQRGEEK